MPDDATFHPLVKSFAYSQRSEKLLITHYVLLQLCSLGTIFQVNFLFNVCYSIAEQIKESLFAQHGGENAVCRCVNSLVSMIFLQILDDNTVAVFQHHILHIFGQFDIWVVIDKVLVLFPEYIEESLFFCCTTVECSLNGHTVFVIVFLVVGEYH